MIQDPRLKIQDKSPPDRGDLEGLTGKSENSSKVSHQKTPSSSPWKGEDKTKNPKPVVGVLALQGGVAEHVAMLRKCGAEVREVRLPIDLDRLCGIILPGGESTAIGKLLHKSGLFESLRESIDAGLPAWGTCAGAILLSKGGSEYALGCGNFSVKRNAYGSQLDSFETCADIASIADDFPLVFIRAPQFHDLAADVKVLCAIKGQPLFLRDRHIWASAFHPELSGDSRVHRAFVEFCGE